MQIYYKLKPSKLDGTFSVLKKLQKKYQPHINSIIREHCAYTILAKFDFMDHIGDVVRSSDQNNRKNLYEYLCSTLSNDFSVCPMWLEVIKTAEGSYGRLHTLCQIA